LGQQNVSSFSVVFFKRIWDIVLAYLHDILAFSSLAMIGHPNFFFLNSTFHFTYFTVTFQGLVPDEIVLKLLKKAMVKHQDTNRFLLDGFPRSVEQAQCFERDIAEAEMVETFRSTSGNLPISGFPPDDDGQIMGKTLEENMMKTLGASS
jgi:hypothetical protein